MEHEGRGRGRATGGGRGGRGAGHSRHHAHQDHSEDGDAPRSQDAHAATRGGRGGARGTPFRPRPGSAGRAPHTVGAAGGPGPAYTASVSGAGAIFASPSPFEGRSGYADHASSPYRGGRGAGGGGRGASGGRGRGGAPSRGGAGAHTPRTPGTYSAVPHTAASAAYTPTPARASGAPADRGYSAPQSQQRAQGPPAQGPGAPFVSPGYTPPPSAYRSGTQPQGHGQGQGQGQAHGGRSHGTIFAEHLHREDALAGLREGRLVVGYLRINARRPRQEAYVPVAGACKCECSAC
jgi:hypothetical protein